MTVPCRVYTWLRKVEHDGAGVKTVVKAPKLEYVVDIFRCGRVETIQPTILNSVEEGAVRLS